MSYNGERNDYKELLDFQTLLVYLLAMIVRAKKRTIRPANKPASAAGLFSLIPKSRCCLLCRLAARRVRGAARPSSPHPLSHPLPPRRHHRGIATL
eukprot:591390-Hanusia_phi.AAC.2